MILMFGMRMIPSPTIKQTQALAPEQRQNLRQLLKLSQELRSAPPPEATRGFEGMVAAHETLKKNNSTGILIGGVSEAIWKYKTIPPVNKRKDVDVMITSGDFVPRPFQEGIDWWVQKKGEVVIRDNAITVENFPVEWWENQYNVMLYFTCQQKYSDISPGLYIPHYPWICALREMETLAAVDERVNVSDEALELFRKKLSEKLEKIEKKGHTLPKKIRKTFEGYILHDNYLNSRDVESWKKKNAFKISPLNLETIAAIKREYGTFTKN